MIYDVCIIGSGASGLTCAIHASFEGLKTCIVEKSHIGGQAATTSRIENYPGYINGVDGKELMQSFYRQALRVGSSFIQATVTGIDSSNGLHTVHTSNGDIQAYSIVLATGLTFRTLQLQGIDEYVGTSVFYGPSVHESPIFFMKNVGVIGDANSAGQAVMHLSHYAMHVYLINKHASIETSMSYELCQEIKKRHNIHIYNNSVTTTLNGENKHLHNVVVKTGISDVTLPIHGLFVCIGQIPDTSWLPSSIKKDSSGHIVIDQNYATSVPGIYAIGDVTSQHVHRVSIAVGDGASVVAKSILPLINSLKTVVK